jgi:phosphoglycerate dehydrogenase-like enzyme
VKLLIKQIDNDGRPGMLPGLLATPWDIEVVDSENSAQFEHALRAADAMVSMSWKGPMPPAPRLQLLQALGAGVDEIDVALAPSWTAVCNCFEHETAIAEYVLAAMLEWTIGVRRMDAHLRRGDWTGAIIDEGALYHALRGRRIGGAIIDVWYRYPPKGVTEGPEPSHLPFHELDNTLMTPHASAWTDGLLPRRSRAIAENRDRLIRGEPLVNVVRAAVSPVQPA